MSDLNKIKNQINSLPRADRVKLSKAIIQGARENFIQRRGMRASVTNYSGSSNSTWKGARKTRHNEKWLISNETADYELLFGELENLRILNRQLVKDSGLAEGTILAYEHMIGAPTSIQSKSDDYDVRKTIDDIIMQWSANCHVSGEYSFDDIINQIVTNRNLSGDVLAVRTIDKYRKGIQTVCQLIEADRIDTPLGGMLSREEYVRHGVQYDSSEAVIGYWVKKLGLSEKENSYLSFGYTGDYSYLPKFAKSGRLNAWLLKRPDGIVRPGQSRQVPLFSTVLPLFKHVDECIDTELIGQKTARALCAFLESSSPDESADIWTDIKGDGGTMEDDNGRLYTYLQPGTMMLGKPGEKVSTVNPSRSVADFDPFILRMLKLLSMKLRIPYAILFQDLAEINFSSYRGGIMEAQKMFKAHRAGLERVFIRPIINSVIEEAFLMGKIPASFMSPDLFKYTINWPAWGSIDPQKEIESNKTAMFSSQTSLVRVTAENGANWEDVLVEKARVKQRAKELEAEYGVSDLLDEKANAKSAAVANAQTQDGDNNQNQGKPE